MKKNFAIRIGRFGISLQLKRTWRTQFEVSFLAKDKKLHKKIKAMAKKRRALERFNKNFRESQIDPDRKLDKILHDNICDLYEK